MSYNLKITSFSTELQAFFLQPEHHSLRLLHLLLVHLPLCIVGRITPLIVVKIKVVRVEVPLLGFGPCDLIVIMIIRGIQHLGLDKDLHGERLVGLRWDADNSLFGGARVHTRLPLGLEILGLVDGVGI